MFRITRTELLSGQFVGIHQVTEPLIGYKKLKCVCDNGAAETDVLAMLEIPTDALVVRSKHINDDDYAYPVKNIRTDQARLVNIEYMDTAGISNIDNCNFFSPRHDPTYQYHVGQIHHPNERLNTDINSSTESGLHFFLSKKDAENF